MKKYFTGFALITILHYSCGKKAHENSLSEKELTTSNDGNTNTAIKKAPLTDGPYQEKYPNGQIKITGEIKNGTRFGQWKSYYENGTDYSEDYFEDGKKNGKTTSYYKNGRIRYIGYYSWDEPSGIWEFYDEEGKLSEKKEYKN